MHSICRSNIRAAWAVAFWAAKRATMTADTELLVVVIIFAVLVVLIPVLAAASRCLALYSSTIFKCKLRLVRTIVETIARINVEPLKIGPSRRCGATVARPIASPSSDSCQIGLPPRHASGLVPGREPGEDCILPVPDLYYLFSAV